MDSNHSPDVLIVGAGPSGLVLALSLLQNGISVRLIEKDTNNRNGQRGAGIMPRSLEVFNTLGVAKDIEKSAIFSPPVRKYELPEGTKVIQTFEMAPYTEPTPACPFPNIKLLGQDNLEIILRSVLEKNFSVHVELGTELKSFEQGVGRVSAHLVKHEGDEEISETATFEWLVGTDGARGVVRKLLGLQFLGETRTVENLIVGDIFVEGLDNDHWHMWGDVAMVLISLRPTEVQGMYNFIIAGRDVDHPQLFSDKEAVVQCLRDRTGRTDLKFGQIPWLSRYIPNIRMVDKFGEGRVFVAGDAAHVHSPTGGQGMNTGVQDCFNLAWKLALVQKRLAHASLLDTYTEERLPVIAEMLDQTTALLNSTFKTDSKDDLSHWRRGGSLLQLGVNYRWSSIVVDERTQNIAEDVLPEDEDEDLRDSYGIHSCGQLRAGDRAPDASELVDNKTTRLFDVFGPSWHTVLVFGGAVDQYEPILHFLAEYPKSLVHSAIIHRPDVSVPAHVDGAQFILEDRKGFAHDAYPIVEGCAVVVVRPDGVVGAIVRGVDGLKRYFDGIFGSKE